MTEFPDTELCWHDRLPSVIVRIGISPLEVCVKAKTYVWRDG